MFWREIKYVERETTDLIFFLNCVEDDDNVVCLNSRNITNNIIQDFYVL